MSTNLVQAKSVDWAMDRIVTSDLVEWATGTGADKQTKRYLEEEIRAFAEGLAGPDPTPVVLTLARTAALAWFAMRLFENRLAGSPEARKNRTMAQADHLQRSIDRAHRRYLATLKTLETVRRLALPVVQINLARQQVNVAGPVQLGSDGARA